MSNAVFRREDKELWFYLFSALPLITFIGVCTAANLVQPSRAAPQCEEDLLHWELYDNETGQV